MSPPRSRPQPVIVDLGCGPGLFLRDLGERYPQATLFGYDVTPAMIAYGQPVAGDRRAAPRWSSTMSPHSPCRTPPAACIW